MLTDREALDLIRYLEGEYLEAVKRYKGGIMANPWQSFTLQVRAVLADITPVAALLTLDLDPDELAAHQASKD